MLYLWMPEGQGKWLWQVDDQGWQLADSLEQLIQTVQLTYQHKEAVVFFPSNSAQFYSQTISKSQYKQLGVAGVQYLMEEYCIEPIDQLDIFHQFHKDQLNIMAISRLTRETYQQSLALMPWQFQALLPDFLIAPEPETDQVNIADVFQHRIFRWARLRGWHEHDLNVLSLLPADNVAKINHYYPAGCAVNNEVDQAISTMFVGQDVEFLQAELPAIDLGKFRQHPFNALSKTKKTKTGFNYWKACAALLAICIVTQISYDTLRWWKYKQLANQTAQLAVDQYKQWFPNETRVNEKNLRSQFSAKMKLNANADTQALQLISRVGPILQQSNIRAEQVQYRNNGLTMNLLAQNSDALTRLTDQFKQQGFAVELGAIRNQGSQVIGMVKVQ